MVRFITLAGRKQVGKDTSARFIKHMITGASRAQVHVVHFADALKEACHAIFGIPLSDMETETGKKKLTEMRWPQDEALYTGVGWRPDPDGKQMTVREVLQFVGTQLFRTQMDPDIWVKSIFRRKYADDDVVVIADCRFPNEADFARERGLLIQITRTTGLEGDSHASEVALDDYTGYHATINNDGSFEQLRATLSEILRTNGFLD